MWLSAADAFLRDCRFGQDWAELTTKAYAGAVALYLRWCERTGRDWRSGGSDLGLVFYHAPLLASEHAARIADAIEKVATSIDELAARGKTIDAPDPD